jgi:hypothetical protein
VGESNSRGDFPLLGRCAIPGTGPNTKKLRVLDCLPYSGCSCRGPERCLSYYPAAALVSIGGNSPQEVSRPVFAAGAPLLPDVRPASQQRGVPTLPDLAQMRLQDAGPEGTQLTAWADSGHIAASVGR